MVRSITTFALVHEFYHAGETDTTVTPFESEAEAVAAMAEWFNTGIVKQIPLEVFQPNRKFARATPETAHTLWTQSVTIELGDLPELSTVFPS